MKYLNYGVISTLILLFCGCSGLRMVSLMKKGEVIQTNFLTEFTYEDRMGLIIIEASINGQPFNFLLDTGAPNVISTEVASKLNLKAKLNRNTGDSQGKKNSLEYVQLDKVTIGGIDFLNTGAAVADLTQSNEIACLEIDGIIGANLMRKALWQIDYQNKQIRISNALDSLLLTDGHEVTFTSTLTGTPKISMMLNNALVEDITVDSGSNQGFSFSKKSYEDVLAIDSTIHVLKAYGNSTSGLYGAGQNDTTYLAICPTAEIGGLSLQNQLVAFRENGSVTLGNEFFENYVVTYDWSQSKITFSSAQEFDNSTFNSFGFKYFFKDDKLIVNEMVSNSSATKSGLQMGDHIIELGGRNYKEIQLTDWCELIRSNRFHEIDTVEIKVLRENEVIDFKFTRSNLFLD